MAPKYSRKSSAGQRLEPVSPIKRTSSRSVPARGRNEVGGSSRGPVSSHHSSGKSEASLPPKPSSAGVGTRGRSATREGRSSSAASKGVHSKKEGPSSSGSPLFSPPDKYPVKTSVGPSKPPKVRRPEREKVDSAKDELPRREGKSQVRTEYTEKLDSPPRADRGRLKGSTKDEGRGSGVASPVTSSSSPAVRSAPLDLAVSRSEAHNKSKAIADGITSSTRGKLNLTPTKHDTKKRDNGGATGQSSVSAETVPVTRDAAALQKKTKPVLDAPAAKKSNDEGARRSKSSSRKKREEEVLKDAMAVQHADKKTWSTHIPPAVLKVLQGRGLEAPFTTHLWKQAYAHPEEEEDDRDRYDDKCEGSCNPHIHQYDTKNRAGYYACIRCKAPICSPKYQVINEERGIAAFQYINAEALSVEIDVSGDAITGKLAPQFNPGAACDIHFLAFCAYCRGCVGICTMSVPASMSAAVTSREIFYANSCCLTYMRYRTSANLKGVVVGADQEEDEREDVLREEDWNMLQSNDDFGLDINDFDSDDGEGPRRPMIDFPSEEDDFGLLQD